jgi:thymidylate synthase ThyX
MINAKVICDSISEAGNRLTTFEIEYPRIIHAELMTHRMFSRNAASSRAIPFAKMQEQLTGRPVRFGQANPGMQDKGEDFDAIVVDRYHHGHSFDNTPEEAWRMARDYAEYWSAAFHEAGYHKQVYNRLTEPFQVMKTIVSATEWANFFWLRNHEAADPTLQELARKMQSTYNESVPQLLKAGEYHLPYVESSTWSGQQHFGVADAEGVLQHVSLEDAIKVSCARCAAVSFRNIDYGVEKSREVYDRLVGDARKHSSALEHVATPMQKEYVEDDYLGTEYDDSVNCPSVPSTWEKGISHADREGDLWSGNFLGFIQHRKTIDGENYKGEPK